MSPFVKKCVLEMEDVLSVVVNRSVYRRAWAGFSSSPLEKEGLQVEWDLGQ